MIEGIPFITNTVHFERAKAPGFNDLERVHINQYEPVRDR